MIRRHSLSAVCMHWFNAFCWIALLFTGFALLSNPAMQPVGMWWADLWTGVFGAYGLLVFHLLIGSAWLAVYFLYLIFGLRHDVIPFLKEVFSLSPASDMTWCVRKGMRLVLGEKAMRSMGLDPALPPQGFYNAGQKLAAVAANAATVKLTDKSGTVTKVLGPLTPENTRMLLMSVVDRDRLWTLSKDGKVAVHLNIRQSDKPIADGKVSLVAYNDVVEVNDGSVWPADTRFLARPET